MSRRIWHTRKGKTMMNYIWKYKTPEGFDDLVMCGDDEALTGLWFDGSRDDWRNTRECERRETPAFRDARRWLDAYFAGHDPGFAPNYRIEGATPFRQAVIDEMLRIPYGATVSYGDIAKAICERKYKAICINEDENENLDVFENIQKKLVAAFEQILPQKSTFEK